MLHSLEDTVLLLCVEDGVVVEVDFDISEGKVHLPTLQLPIRAYLLISNDLVLYENLAAVEIV